MKDIDHARLTHDFEVGDLVRLKPGYRVTAKARIESFYIDIEGGVRLERKLGGFFSWNVYDLEHAKDEK